MIGLFLSHVPIVHRSAKPTAFRSVTSDRNVLKNTANFPQRSATKDRIFGRVFSYWERLWLLYAPGARTALLFRSRGHRMQ